MVEGQLGKLVAYKAPSSPTFSKLAKMETGGSPWKVSSKAAARLRRKLTPLSSSQSYDMLAKDSS